MIFIYSLVLLFILKLRFPKGKSIIRILVERYGHQVIKVFRQFEKFDFKLKKLECDLQFLNKCKSNNLIPKFVNFKLYDDNIRSTHFYKSFQRKLLEQEIKTKLNAIKNAEKQLRFFKNGLQNSTSYLILFI